MSRLMLMACAVVLPAFNVLAQSTAATDTIMPTPTTVAWGYYDAAAKPVLHINSGDELVVGTLLTSSPKRLEAAGVPPADVEQSLRDIFDKVTDKGPGGHILTGPIYINSAPPGIHAGNLDNKELVAGTTLYIPVFTRGALLEIGDGHAGQGNGEVDITALETSLVGTFQVIVRKDMHLTWPRGETPTHWIAMATDKDLVVATKTAVRQAIEFLMSRGLSKDDAYMLTSVACDVDITQLVDGNVGVHVMIPKSIFASHSSEMQH